MADVILAVLIFVPVLITLVLRSNAALAFLVLCGSFTLITFGSADLKELTGHLDLRVDSGTLNLVILILPVLLTLLLTRHSFSGHLKGGLHLAAAACCGVLLALVSIPLLNSSLRTNFSGSWGWDNLQTIQTPVIAAGLVLSLFLIWFGGHAKASKHGKKHK